jgi:hypothetical protein
MKTSPDGSRRRFVASAVLAALGLPLASRSWAKQPGGLPRLSPDNPQAKALAYIEDAAQARHPNYKAGSTCANCQFFQASTGACSVFPGFSVAPAGWCLAWAKAPG